MKIISAFRSWDHWRFLIKVMLLLQRPRILLDKATILQILRAQNICTGGEVMLFLEHEFPSQCICINPLVVFIKTSSTTELQSCLALPLYNLRAVPFPFTPLTTKKFIYSLISHQIMLAPQICVRPQGYLLICLSCSFWNRSSGLGFSCPRLLTKVGCC